VNASRGADTLVLMVCATDRAMIARAGCHVRVTSFDNKLKRALGDESTSKHNWPEHPSGN
jgi:hypothetical protein